jgi:hypothetical protein
MKWMKLNWTKLRSSDSIWTEIDWTEQTELNWSHFNWTDLIWTKLKKLISTDWHTLNWTKLKWTEVKLNELQLTELNWTELYCTAWVPDRIQLYRVNVQAVCCHGCFRCSVPTAAPWLCYLGFPVIFRLGMTVFYNSGCFNSCPGIPVQSLLSCQRFLSLAALSLL